MSFFINPASIWTPLGFICVFITYLGSLLTIVHRITLNQTLYKKLLPFYLYRFDHTILSNTILSNTIFSNTILSGHRRYYCRNGISYGSTAPCSRVELEHRIQDRRVSYMYFSSGCSGYDPCKAQSS